MAHIEYTATVEAGVPTRFTCLQCGHEAVAVVRSKGVGKASGGLFWEDEAKQKARDGADVNLQENAHALTKMAPCPSCTYVDTEAVTSAQSSARGMAILIL